MEAPSLLATLKKRGIFITLQGGEGSNPPSLRVLGANLLKDSDLISIKKHRDALLEYLGDLPEDPALPILQDLGVEVQYPGLLDPELDSVLTEFESLAAKGQSLGLDIETFGPSIQQGSAVFHGGLDPNIGSIRSIQLATRSKALVLDSRELGDCSATMARIKKLLTSGRFIAHNALFERQWLQKNGMPPGTLGCSMMAARIVFGLPNGRYPSLAWCAEKLLGIQLSKETRGSDWSCEGPLSPAQVHYAALDAVLALRLSRCLADRLQEMGSMDFYRLTMRALPTVADAMTVGIAFDQDTHAALVPKWEAEANHWREEISRQVPDIKNPASAPQVAAFLESHLTPEEFHEWPRTDTGNLATGKSELSAWPDCPEALLRFKKINSMATTFGQKFADRIHPVTGRLHGNFSLLGTSAGRFACSNPNIQNPPALDEFRALFVSDPGYVLVGADFSQIELRLCGILSGDPVVMDAYRNGIDLHRLTASRMAGCSLEEVTSSQRKAAKPVNFGLIYGMSAKTLAQTAWASYQVRMSLQEAEAARQAFFNLYQGIARWQRETANISEMSGKALVRPGLIRNMRANGDGWTYTKSLNTPVQGAGAACLLASLARIPKVLDGVDGNLVHHIHDEIILEVAEASAQVVADRLAKAMVAAFLEIFPEHTEMTRDLVEVHIGTNWAALKD